MHRRFVAALVTALALGACGSGTTSGNSGSTSAGTTANSGTTANTSGTDGTGANGGSTGSTSASTGGSTSNATSTSSSTSTASTSTSASSTGTSASATSSTGATGSSTSSTTSTGSTSTSTGSSTGSTSTSTSSSTGSTATGSSTSSAGSTGTSGTDLTCAQSTSTTVPADAYAIANSGGSVYAFLRDDTHWTVINSGSGTTRTISFPTGFTSMHVMSVELAPSGEQLILFAASGTTPTHAAFFSAGTFSAPIALPANTVTAHADAQDHLFAVDGSNVLWDGSGGSFINRGGLPLTNVNTYYGGYWNWNVAPNGRVYLAYIDQGQQFVWLMWLDAGALGWSNAINTIPQSQSTLAGLDLAIGRDGSVHLGFTLVDTSGMEYGSPTYYIRSQDGSTWGQGETLHNVETVNDINYSYGIVSLVALGYDTAQAYLEGYGLARYANRCGAAQPWYGWNWVALAADGSLTNNPEQMSVDENGTPAFLMPVNGIWEVQQNQ
ncbi:MAG: hypothetical protein JST54_06025 [Deltaproteobacteria bacterium]|nr:hypothetical protein [Deltaproteobacteria bacterium]